MSVKRFGLFMASLPSLVFLCVGLSSCSADDDLRVYEPIDKLHIGEQYVFDTTLNNIRQGDSVVVLNFYKDEVTDLDYVDYDEDYCCFVFRKVTTSNYKISWDFSSYSSYVEVQYGQNGMWYKMNQYDWKERILTANDGMTVRMVCDPSKNQINLTVNKFSIEEYIPEMMHYNLNDVFIVAEMARLFPDEIKLRYSLSSSYKVNLLSSSRSNIANILFEKFYSEFSGLHPSQWKGQKTIRTVMAFNKVIFPIIKFKTKYMQDYLERIRNVKVTRTNKDSFEETIQIGNLKYTMATGGLHSQDPPRALYSKHEFMTSPTGEQTLTPDSYTYIHWDIASFYPSIMAVYHVAPKHLIEDIFAKLVKYFRDTRVKAKHSKEDFIDGIPPKLLAEAFKIVINSIYGKFGDENSPILHVTVEDIIRELEQD